MNMLEEYIRDHISLVNKNNHIHIIVGEKICEGIFNAKLSTLKVEQFMKHMHGYKDTTLEHFKVYKNKHSITKINNKRKKQYSYVIDKDTILNIQSSSVLCCMYQILDYDDSIISTYHYDSIRDIQVYTININHLFVVEIENSYDTDNTEYFKLTIIIKKPHKHLFNKIKDILMLLYE